MVEMLKLLASRLWGGVGECVVTTGWVEELPDFTRDSSGEKMLDEVETGRPEVEGDRGSPKPEEFSKECTVVGIVRPSTE